MREWMTAIREKARKRAEEEEKQRADALAKGGFTNPKAIVEASNSKDAEEIAPRRRVRHVSIAVASRFKSVVVFAVSCPRVCSSSSSSSSTSGGH
jgi:uncharacterized protein YggE